MRFEDLEYLVDVGITNSISRTANRMFISQQALSKSMKKLEEEFGCNILIRTKNGTFFTDEGKIILEFAQNVLSGYNNVRNLILNEKRPSVSSKIISIYSFSGITNIVLPDTYSILKKEKPYINFLVREESDVFSMCDLILKDKYSFGFVTVNKELFSYLCENDRYVGICKEVLMYDQMIACVRLASKYITKEGILPNNMIVDQKGCYSISPYGFWSNEVFKMLLFSNDMHMYKELIKKNDMVVYMPRLIAKKFFNSKVYRVLELEKPYEIIHILMYPRQLDDDMRAILDLIKRIFGEMA